MARRAAATLFVASVILFLPGCSIPVELKAAVDQFDAAIKTLNNLIASVDKARTEAAQWRVTLPELEQSFARHTDEHLDKLGLIVKSALEDLERIVSDDPQSLVKYIETTLKANLEVLHKALVEARAKLDQEKPYLRTAAISEVFRTVAETKVWYDPYVASFRPTQIDLVWDDYTKQSYQFLMAPVRQPALVIRLRGWGFKRPTGQTLHVELFARSEAGSRAIGDSWVAETTEFLLQITLYAEKKPFTENDKQLIIKWGDGPYDSYTLPVVFESAPPPPKKEIVAPLERVTDVIIEYQCLKDDKDPEDSVRHTLTAAGTQVSRKEYSQGVRWPNPNDNFGPFPGRIVGQGFQRHWDFSHEEDRTFKLDNPVELGKGTTGVFSVEKLNTDQGWHFRVALRGVTDKGRADAS